MNKLRKLNEGFTIIEVLIVLAIAGLIMLIVFLAVPALQRNSRNTAIRNDAGNVLAGIGEFSANNNGQLPTTVGPAGPDGTVPISGGAGTSATSAKVRAGTLVSNTAGTPTTTGTIWINFNKKCNGNALDPGTTNRAVAATYLAETGSGATPTASQCTES